VQLDFAGVASQQGHPSEPDSALDIEKYDSILDRTLTARPQHFQRSELDAVKGYAYKWLTLQRGRANAPPPDDIVAAQIATAAGGAARAIDWIRDHLQDRQAENCAYLVSALLQQLHSIAPPTVRRRRAELRVVRRGSESSAKDGSEAHTSRQPKPDLSDSLLKQAVANCKTLR
jgi:hypothetical protein